GLMSGDLNDRAMLRHTVATLAYRAEKVLRDAPAGFDSTRLSPATRTPLEIVSHLGDLMEWAERMARGEYRWVAQPTGDWKAACDRFFAGLVAVDDALAVSTLDVIAPGVIFQGPIADALTHVGQLSMIRGTVGAPVRPESYAKAEIQTGRVGREQSSMRKEFDGDASAARR
ncbi:MAG: hypothetical protein ACREMY_22475, partial [bacterium]